MKTRAWLACLALGVLCLTGSSPAEAREYPSKPITLVNPFGAGSSADIVVRLVEPFIKKAFGVNVIMSYKEGAGAVVGVNEFVTMRPDGYSILYYNYPHYQLQPRFGKTLFRPGDLEPLMWVNAAPEGLLVRSDSPFKTIQEFLDYARENPGRLTIGNTGTFSSNHVTYALLEKETGLKFTRVPFTNGSKSMTAVLAGEIDAAFISAEMIGCYEGKMRVLAVAGEGRMSILPDVPTFGEVGYPGIVNVLCTNFFTQKGVPPEILEDMRVRFSSIVNDPEFRALMRGKGYSAPMGDWKAQKANEEAIAGRIESVVPLFEAERKNK